MRPITYSAKPLVTILRRSKIATMSELKGALGSDVDLTVLRKLNALGYRTSFSHGGRYYALDRHVDFDEDGLWFCKGVGFSRHGTLLETLVAMVDGSEAGADAGALERRLQVRVLDALRILANRDRLVRERIDGRYVYFAPQHLRRQRQARQTLEQQSPLALQPLAPEPQPEELKAAIVLFTSLLDEQQRRLYAGLESSKCGHGGDGRIATLLGLDAKTVARGRRELLQGDVVPDRVRRPGGGRKKTEKKRR